MHANTSLFLLFNSCFNVFCGGTVSAVLATVIYSIPPIIRLTSLGLTQVSGTYSEVSRSFGGTLIQTLNKLSSH